MKCWLKVLLLCAAPILCDAVPLRYTLDYDVWLQPRDGHAVRGLEAVSNAVLQWRTYSASMIDIRYPSGDSGVLWANELRDWMIALGIAGEHIQLTPGSSRSDHIYIDVHQPLSR